MSTESETALAELCSALQYLVDRGEFAEGTEVLTRVRYTQVKTVAFFDLISHGRLVRVSAEDRGPAPVAVAGEDDLYEMGGVQVEATSASEALSLLRNRRP